jgi:hypothetical protein
MVVTPYPSIPDNFSDSFYNVLSYVNSVASHGAFAGLLGFLLVLLVFGVSFLSLSAFYPFDKRILASLFLSFIVSVFLSVLGLTAPIMTPALLILTFVAWILTRD